MLHLSERVDSTGCYYGHYQGAKKRYSVDIAVPRSISLGRRGASHNRIADDTKWLVYIDGIERGRYESLEEAKASVATLLGS